MLRITITESTVEQRWVLQGRLVEPWVGELETTWKKSRSRRDNRRCVVDLSEVTLIDKRGETVLKTMRRAGAELIACGVYTKHVVEGINSQCKRRCRNLLACLLAVLLWSAVPSSFGQSLVSTLSSHQVRRSTYAG